jgi:predicted amidohydrolase YtcJ
MLVLHNAKIYTLNPQTPQVSALVIDQGKIIAIGDSRVILDSYARNLRRATLPDCYLADDQTQVDLQGRTVLPGLTDAHIHLEHYSLGLQKIDCETDTRDTCLERVAERAKCTPPGVWLLGHGWNQNNWSDGFGNADDLDAAAPHQPVYLTAKSLHAAWVNQVALRLAGITASTPDPAGGRIGRDAVGEPNGILYESAMSLVSGIIPEPTVGELVEALRIAQKSFLEMGITGVHDFDRQRCFFALQSLHASGELGLRVVKSIPLEDLPHAAATGLSSGFGDNFLRIGSVKGFADGALGPQTAAMLQPYEGSPQNRGILLLDGEELFERGRQAVDGGLSLAIHAIGDLANHEVLNAFEQLRAYENRVQARSGFGSKTVRQLRHRIEHVQLVHPSDAGRLAQLGVIASMQPSHAPSDMLMADRFWGPRAAFSYAWRTQLEAGAVLAFGSDAPVESPNPFWGLHAAVTRQRLDGSLDPQGWYPEQRLSLMEALQGFTTGPAYAAGVDDHLGQLHPGYLADLIVLEQDPFQIAAGNLHAIKPVATMVDGKWVFIK